MSQWVKDQALSLHHCGFDPECSRLRIWSCHSCGIGHSYSLDWIPDWELPYVVGVAKKKKIHEYDAFFFLFFSSL